MLSRRLLRHTQLTRTLTRTLSTTPRPLSTTPRPLSTPFLRPTPSPPRLSEKEQAEFERLQRKSTGAFSTSHNAPDEAPPTGTEEQMLHPDIRRGAPPEFEGDVNPKTGEVGGPKNDPLRHGDYSFNGRVTDF